MRTERIRPAPVSAPCGDALRLPQRAQQVPTGELAEIGIAPAAAHQFNEEVWIVFDAVEALREERRTDFVRAL
jgi:hypothetical protein